MAVPFRRLLDALQSILAVRVGLCALVLRSWAKLEENRRFLRIAISQGLYQKLFGLDLTQTVFMILLAVKISLVLARGLFAGPVLRLLVFKGRSPFALRLNDNPF